MGFVTLAHAMAPFVFWMAFVAWLKLHQPADAVSIGINRWLNRAFNSAPAQFLSARSYSTYLIHEPIIHLIMYVCINDFALGMWQTASFALILTPALTLLSSVFLYRYVEAPAIAYGNTLFRNIPDALDLGAAPPAPAHRPLRR
jgi:peptidoglycan/LPS O-acetylase OafA/YrhL